MASKYISVIFTEREARAVLLGVENLLMGDEDSRTEAALQRANEKIHDALPGLVGKFEKKGGKTDMARKPTEEIEAKDGLLWREGKIIELPEADDVARANGYNCAEEMVRELTIKYQMSKNPFVVPTPPGFSVKEIEAIVVSCRLERIKQFGPKALREVIACLGMQKTVRKAAERRLKKLEAMILKKFAQKLSDYARGLDTAGSLETAQFDGWFRELMENGSIETVEKIMGEIRARYSGNNYKVVQDFEQASAIA